jgi:hypothetical protein
MRCLIPQTEIKMPYDPYSFRTPSFLPDDEEEQRFNRARPVGPMIRGPVALPIPNTNPNTPARPAMLPPPNIGGIKPLESTLDRSQVPIPSLDGKGGTTPYSPINAARYDYVTEAAKRNPEGNIIPGEYKRSFGDILKGTLAGVGQAVAAGNGQNNLGSAIGGALAGGIGSAVNPRAGRELVFDTSIRPRMERDIAAQQQQAAIQQANEDRALKNAKVQAEANQANANAEKARRLPEPKPTLPIRSPRGLYDPATKKIIPGTEPLPKPEKPISLPEAEAERAQIEGSQEQIAADTLAGRLESLKGRLSPRERAIINGEAVDVDPKTGQPTYADDIEEAQAHRRWQQIQDDEMRNIRRGTAENSRTRAQSIRRTGMLPEPGKQAGGQPKATVGQDFVNFVSQRLKITPEEARKRIEGRQYQVK